ncbi:hypothetical protein ACER0A_012345 [Haloimpatiens sp. FM7315]|uniref:hypothetical protein n=1 Tax=Haloimpatiens sp. FM7315 TaxID=3298609 RepID=UPI00370B8929
MSWYRRIKTLFNLELSIFLYIIWINLSYVFFGVKTNYLVMIVGLVSMFLMHYLNYKTKKVYLALVLSLVLGMFILLISYKSIHLTIFNMFYILILEFASFKLEEQYIDHYVGNIIIKKSLLILMLIWIVAIIFRADSTKYFFRFYLIYTIIGIVYLRQMRDYNYNIINRKSTRIDMVITILVFSISSSKVFEGFYYVVKIIKKGLYFLADKIIDFLVYVLDKPFNSFFEYFKRLFINLKINGEFENINLMNKKAKVKRYTENRHYLKDITWLKYAIMAIVIIIVLLFLFNIIQRLMASINNEENKNVIKEEKEKILDREIKGKNKNKLSSLLKDVYYLKDAKGKIKHVYKNFEKISRDKELYKNYMTAKQLGTSVKVNSEVPKDEVNKITDIYNEAKFSNHTVEEENAKIIKQSFDSVKNKI